MDDLNKDEHIHDREAHKKLAHQPPPSSNSVLPETSEKIRTSAWITLAILGCTLLVTFYGETMLLPAIRDIIGDFHISYSTSSWILTAYLISGAVMTPIAGKLSDIYGRKKMVLIIFIIYIIGISAGGLSSNISFLVIARVIQGIGISMFPIAFGIIKRSIAKGEARYRCWGIQLNVCCRICSWLGSRWKPYFLSALINYRNIPVLA